MKPETLERAAGAGSLVEKEAFQKLPGPARFVVVQHLHPDLTVADQKVMAGYSAKTPTAVILRTKQGQKALQSVEEQRVALREKPGYKMHDIAKRLHGIATTKTETADARIRADRTLIELEGLTAPKQVQIEQHGLLMEFKDLTSDDLRQLQDSIVGGMDDFN